MSGEGTSHRSESSSKSSNSYKNKEVIDAEWREVSSSTSSGKNYVSNLLQLTTTATSQPRLTTSSSSQFLLEDKNMKHSEENMNQNELYHHGVLGMKWGVRRYQNADGTLTAKGRARFNKVENSGLRSKLDTLGAKGVLKYNSKLYSGKSIVYDKKADREAEVANKFSKSSESYKSHNSKSKEYRAKAEEFIKLSDASTKMLRDINSNKIKAGKDFIVQRDLNFRLTKIGAIYDYSKGTAGKDYKSTTALNPWIGSVDYKIIEKSK